MPNKKMQHLFRPTNSKEIYYLLYLPWRTLKFSTEEIDRVYKKHHPYFQKLGVEDQLLFAEWV